MGQPKTAPPSDVVAVVEGTPPDTAVGAMSDQGATAMVVAIAGGPHMRDRAMPVMRDAAAVVATAKACRVNTAAAIAGGRSMRARLAMAVAKACRINTVAATARNRTMRATAAVATARACRLNMRIIPAIAAMVALASDLTLSVTITVAAVRDVPGNLRADSLPVAAVVGSGIAQAVDARPDDANVAAAAAVAATTDDNDTTTVGPGYAAQIAPCHPLAFSV
jgi:hypothetical protein